MNMSQNVIQSGTVPRRKPDVVVSGFLFQISGFGFRVLGFRFLVRVSGFGSQDSGFGFRVPGLISTFGFLTSCFMICDAYFGCVV